VRWHRVASRVLCVFAARCYASVSYAIMWRVSVMFVHSVKTNKHIFEVFSPLDSQTILVFPYQMAWHYFKGGTPLMRALNAHRVVGRNCDSEPISGFTACC